MCAGCPDPDEFARALAQARARRADRYYRDFPASERTALAKKGQALPGGGFPIPNCKSAADAIHAVGRAKNPAAARAHIRSRVKALGCSGSIFDNWK